MNKEMQTGQIKKCFVFLKKILISVKNGERFESASIDWILHHKTMAIVLFVLFIAFIAANGISGILALLFLLSIVLFVLGFIKPSVVKMNSRKKVVKYIGSSLLTLFILITAVSTGNSAVNNNAGSTIVYNQTKNQSKDAGAKPQAQDQTVSNNPNDTSNPEAGANNENQSIGLEANKTDNAQATNQQTSSGPDTSTPLYAVSSVTDGDTLKVNINGTVQTVRLIGMDTPETVDPRKPVQCFGKEASNKAKELLSGRKVRIEKDQTQGELDKYGRTLAYVYRDDGLFYNKYMIEQGYAHEYTYNTPYKYQSEFKTAEKSARENQSGLWSPTTCSGNTTTAATSSITTPANTTASGIYYTSSYYSSKYYYPEKCAGWQSLSSQYLKKFNSLSELLSAYPSRTMSPQCQ